jgi:hypothetical protein
LVYRHQAGDKAGIQLTSNQEHSAILTPFEVAVDGVQIGVTGVIGGKFTVSYNWLFIKRLR